MKDDGKQFQRSLFVPVWSRHPTHEAVEENVQRQVGSLYVGIKDNLRFTHYDDELTSFFFDHLLKTYCRAVELLIFYDVFDFETKQKLIGGRSHE